MQAARGHVIALGLAALACSLPVAGQNRSIVVASAASMQDSGLFDFILPMFKARTGIEVRLIVQGTSQALDTGRHGGADIVFVHAKT